MAVDLRPSLGYDEAGLDDRRECGRRDSERELSLDAVPQMRGTAICHALYQNSPDSPFNRDITQVAMSFLARQDLAVEDPSITWADSAVKDPVHKVGEASCMTRYSV